MKKYVLLAIFIAALLSRVVGISNYPIGFTQDEASFGYDAYSLLLTGKDQWGETLPLVLRSFGDFKLPLYSYLTIPSIYFFGLNEFAIRSPNALFGSLAVVSTYLMVYELFKNKKIALLSSLILLISPWHVSLSRGAFEANLTSFFTPLAVWGFLKGLKNPKFMAVSAFAFGLNLFSYHSARFFTPALILILVILFRKELPLSSPAKLIKKYKFALVVIAVFLSFAFFTMFSGAQKRGLDILIINPTDKWASVSDRRYEAVLSGLPDKIARIFSNKLEYTADRFFTNYISYLSPEFLFVRGAGEWTYGMIPGRGVLYLIELPFILLALIKFIKNPDKKVGLIILWILISPLPAAITKGPGYAANRAAVMIPAIQILSAYGIYLTLKLITKTFGIGIAKYSQIVLSLLFIIGFVYFIEDYLYHAPIRAAESMRYGMKESFHYIGSIDENYDEVVVSKSLSVPQIWIGFYKLVDLDNYQRNARSWLRYEKLGISYVDQLDRYELDKYTFDRIDVAQQEHNPKYLLVGKPEDFILPRTIIKEITYPDGKPAIYIVEGE
jgi:4-amino-4-deoxy-L-arabinose transferase-like glycosyltransferase